jgi:arylsulfatase A-like enzyme
MPTPLCRRDFLTSLARTAIATGGAGLALAAGAPRKRKKPLNVVVILIDDLGWTDLGCYGSQFYETPNVDRLAAMGVRFTDGYAACTVCSPTRVSLMAGKYPARVNLTDWISGHKRPWAKLQVPDWTMRMKHEEVSLAEAVGPLGYADCFIGKWHLGPKDYWPKSQGFDINIGGYSRGAPPSYFAPYRIPTMEDGPKGEYLTDRHAQDAEAFIEDHADKPFFLYLSMYAVHTPLQAKKPLIEKYKAKAAKMPDYPQNHPVYAAMVHSMDQCVGRVMKKLDALDLLDDTAVLFIGDNGGLIGNPRRPVTVNLGIRAGKGSSYEGGVRVPFIVYWPGVTTPGTVCREPVISCDFYPTILDMVGATGDPEHNKTVDGVSLAPLLDGSAKRLDRDALYWHYPHYHPGGATPYGAIRQRDWKLIEFFEDMHVELYNLREDQAEQNNLSETMPEKANELRNKLHQWRESVDAQMPKPNPNYDPDRARSRRGGRRKIDRKGRKHPDFAILRGGSAKITDFGYDLETNGEATALKKLKDPLTRRAVFQVKMKTHLEREDGWQNGFLAISDSGKDKDLMVAGVYIGGLQVAIFEGLNAAGGPKVSQPAQFDRQKTFDLKVTVDLQKRTVTASAAGVTVSKPLPKDLKAVRYVGYHAMQTKTAFGPIQVSGE